MDESRKVYVEMRCPICENLVSDKCKDTAELLNHIRICHPPIQSDEKADVKQKGRFQGLKKTARRLNPFKKSSVRSGKIDNRNKKDVHGEKILCPACNVESTPLLFEKSSRQFITDCRLGAICLLGCWPLCFVPLMISRDKRVRMVCPLCGYDYGTYVVRNAKGSAIIVDTAETIPRPTGTPSKTSSIRFCRCNENTITANTCDELTIRDSTITEEFDDDCSAISNNYQKRGFNEREMQCDPKVECPKSESNAKEAETFPVGPSDYADERLDRKMKPMKMETCEFCSAEEESNSECSSHWHQKLSARHQPLSKCYDDREYSTFQHRQCGQNGNPVPMACQRSRCGHENLNCCETIENTGEPRDRIISRHRRNVCNDRSCGHFDDWTDEHLPLFTNDENLYVEDNCETDWL